MRPVVEGSEDESADGSGVASGLSSMAFSESASDAAVEEEASVGLNRLMKGRRLRISGLVELLLMTSFCSVSDSSSSTDDAAVVDLKVASVLLNRLRNVGRFRVDPSDDGGVVKAAISGFRSRFNSA